MSTLSGQSRRLCRVVAAATLVSILGSPSQVWAEGEPAADFLKRLRAARYFDTAITYLDRLGTYPGVDEELKGAIGLEKAQTYIEAAVASRSAKDRDSFFELAETSLSDFLKNKNHPRIPEARMQLGKLQMVRATQFMLGDADDAKREQARELYASAGKTFDSIVEDLKVKLTEMRGQKIDANKEPEKVALRDRYQFDYLQAQLSAADVRKLAAETYAEPGKDGKALLEEAKTKFEALATKYSKYAQGVISLMHLGQINQALGNSEKAIDNYLRALESPDADPLRDSKYQAAAGLIELRLAESPPKFQDAIDRGKGLARAIRPNERQMPSVQEFRLQLAKAYLTKSKDEKQKPTDVKRAESESRSLLRDASKVPGPQFEETKKLLAGFGIEQEAAELPKAEPPESLQDAFDKARELLTVNDSLSETLKTLEDQEETAELAKQKKDIATQLSEQRSIAIQILRGGLAMANSNIDNELLNQARSYLAYTLVQDKRHRDATVVGQFLARSAPGTDVGLRGGLMALNSLQNLLAEVPDDENDGLIAQLEMLGDFMVKTWPNDPKASAAQGLRVRLMLSKEKWAEARELIEAMPKGPESASLSRLLGQLLWNHALGLRQEGDNEAADKILLDAVKDLQTGLDNAALIESEGLQAALTLAKILLKQKKAAEALAVLDHEKYGPTVLVNKLGAPNERFKGDLYTTELKVLVQVMIASDGDIAPALNRATQAMENLRDSFVGAEGQAKLTSTYRRLAFDVRQELNGANPAKKAKLIQIFKVLLERIADATDDRATLLWVAQTLNDLGEAAMQPGDTKAQGQAKELLEAAVKNLDGLRDGKDLTISYLYGRANRLLGKYKPALDALEKILVQKPMMLDAQKEAAQAYESWAAALPPATAAKAYRAALSGKRPGKDGKNIIWGWGKISQMTSGNPKFKSVFFEARYHVALTRYQMGKIAKQKAVIEQAEKDITTVEALYPEMGGNAQRTKFDLLLKEIQKAAGKQAKGLKPLPPKAAPANPVPPNPVAPK